MKKHKNQYTLSREKVGYHFYTYTHTHTMLIFKASLLHCFAVQRRTSVDLQTPQGDVPKQDKSIPSPESKKEMTLLTKKVLLLSVLQHHEESKDHKKQTPHLSLLQPFPLTCKVANVWHSFICMKQKFSKESNLLITNQCLRQLENMRTFRYHCNKALAPVVNIRTAGPGHKQWDTRERLNHNTKAVSLTTSFQIIMATL